MTANQVQIRRDSATNLNASTPATGELGYDTTNKALRLGDGSTLGGIWTPNVKMLLEQSLISGNAGGTADALTLTLTPVPAAYTSLMRVVFKATATNATTTPTLNVNSLGAKTIKKKTSSGKAAVAAGDIQNGCIYAAVYDGTDFQLEAVDIAGATGGWTQIGSTLTPTGTTANFTSIPSTYTDLLMVAENISCDTASRYPNMTAYRNGVGSALQGGYIKLATTTVSGNANSGFQLSTVDTTTQAAASTCSYGIIIFNYTTNSPIVFIWKGYGTGAGTDGFIFGCVDYQNVGIVDTIDNSWSGSGNFDGSSTLKLYGRV